MDEPSEAEARQILRNDGADVVAEPWEEQVEVVEAGLDDTTAPQPDPGGAEGEARGASAPNAPPPPGTSIGEGPATGQ